MKISIMIITYNRADLLKETMDSILNQTFKDFELIVVDNYSTDDTEKTVKNYNDDRIKYFKNRNDGILAVNRNFMVSKAKGEYVAICDDDDLWMPDKLERQLNEFEKDEGLGLVCTNGLFFGDVNKKCGKSKDEYLTLEKLLDGNVVTCSSIMAKKSVLDEVGPFDEGRDILGGGDYELWLRISKKYKIKYIGTPLIKYRMHAAALQNIYLKGTKNIEL